MRISFLIFITILIGVGDNSAFGGSRSRCRFRLAAQAPQAKRVHPPSSARDNDKNRRKKEEKRKKARDEKKRKDLKNLNQESETKKRMRAWIQNNFDIAYLARQTRRTQEATENELLAIVMPHARELSEKSNAFSTLTRGGRQQAADYFGAQVNRFQNQLLNRYNRHLAEAASELSRLSQDNSDLSLNRQKALLREVLTRHNLAKDWNLVSPGEAFTFISAVSPSLYDFAMSEFTEKGFIHSTRLTELIEKKPEGFNEEAYRTLVALNIVYLAFEPPLTYVHHDLFVRCLKDEDPWVRFVSAIALILSRNDAESIEAGQAVLAQTITSLRYQDNFQLFQAVIRKHPPENRERIDKVIREILEDQSENDPTKIAIALGIASPALLQEAVAHRRAHQVLETGNLRQKGVVVLALLGLPEEMVTPEHVDMFLNVCRFKGEGEDSEAWSNIKKQAVYYLGQHASFKQLVTLFIETDDPALTRNLGIRITMSYLHSSPGKMRLPFTSADRERMRHSAIDSSAPTEVVSAIIALSVSKDLQSEDVVAVVEGIYRMRKALATEYNELVAQTIDRVHTELLARARPFYESLLEGAVEAEESSAHNRVATFFLARPITGKLAVRSFLGGAMRLLEHHSEGEVGQKARTLIEKIIEEHELADEAQDYVEKVDPPEDAVAFALFLVRQSPVYRPRVHGIVALGAAIGNAQAALYLEEQEQRRERRRLRRAPEKTKEASTAASDSSVSLPEVMTLDRAVTDLSRLYAEQSTLEVAEKAFAVLDAQVEQITFPHLKELVHLARNAESRLPEEDPKRQVLLTGLKKCWEKLPLSQILKALDSQQVAGERVGLFLVDEKLAFFLTAESAATLDELTESLLKLGINSSREKVRSQALRQLILLESQHGVGDRTQEKLKEELLKLEKLPLLSPAEITLVALNAAVGEGSVAEHAMTFLSSYLSLGEIDPQDLDYVLIERIVAAGRVLLDEKVNPRIRLALAAPLSRIPGYDTEGVANLLRLAELGTVSPAVQQAAKQAEQQLAERHGPILHASVTEFLKTFGLVPGQLISPFTIPAPILAFQRDATLARNKGVEGAAEELRRSSEALSMFSTIATEVLPRRFRGYGRYVQDVSANPRMGYDLFSIDFRTGEVRLIEVKGKFHRSNEIAISRHEARMANVYAGKSQMNYYICVVSLGSRGEIFDLHLVKNPVKLEAQQDGPGFLSADERTFWFDLPWFLTPRAEGGLFFFERLLPQHYESEPR